MLVGTDTGQLVKAIELLTGAADATGDSLADHPAIVDSNKRLDPRRKIELHVSAANLFGVYMDDELGPYVNSENVTSVAVTLPIICGLMFL